MNYTDWDSRTWNIVDATGSTDLDKGDVLVFAFDPDRAEKLEIRDVRCPHDLPRGLRHGRSWIGVVCDGAGALATGRRGTTSTAFAIRSSKPEKEQLHCDDPALPGSRPDGILSAASWTAEEGAGGRDPGRDPGDDPEQPGHPRKPRPA